MSEASEPQPSKQPARTRLFFKIALALVLVFIAFLFLPSFFMAAGSGVLGAIALGWWSFLRRTLPGISWNWDIVNMSAFCVLLILILAHVFLRWITKSISSASGRNWQWPWTWTWCGLVGVALLFLVGMSVGGAIHQIGWVLGSKEPLYEQKPRWLGDMMKLRELNVEFRVVLLDSNTVDAVRHAIANSDGEKRWQLRGEKSLIQSCHILLVVTNGGIVHGAVIFPRDAQTKSRVGGYYTTQTDSVPVPAANLPELLKQHETHLVAF